MSDLNRKIDFAIKLLRSIPQDGPIELCYSGGKDSDVILELAKMSGIPFEAIYKQTSIDPPGTTAHAKDVGATIIRPKKTFFQLVEQKGCPTRRARFCCEYLKEYKIYDRAIQGIRRSESSARKKRYKEPEFCRLYPKNEKVRVYLPILEWTNEDVEGFILQRGIKCAPIYYDEDGTFRVKRRLGCIGCPMKSDNGVSDYLRYPKMLRALVNSEKKYILMHQKSRAKEKFHDAYGVIYNDLFCDSYDDYVLNVTGGLFPELAIDPKKYMEDYFGIEL